MLFAWSMPGFCHRPGSRVWQGLVLNTLIDDLLKQDIALIEDVN
jgi:hypothetical protein